MTRDVDSHDLIMAISTAVRVMPLGHIESLAEAIIGRDVQEATANALAAVASPTYRSNARDFLEAWARSSTISNEAAALALLAGAAVRDAAVKEESIEIVWTGPSSHEVPIRRTREVLLELIGVAESRLTVVSFAAYKVPEVITSIEQAGRRGVDVRLVLESTADSQGRLTHDAADAFRSLGDTARFFAWPAELRSSPEGATGALHAKAVIADRRAAFVTSANLTGHALNANMELGLHIRGGDIPRRLDAHFDYLIAGGVLKAVT